MTLTCKKEEIARINRETARENNIENMECTECVDRSESNGDNQENSDDGIGKIVIDGRDISKETVNAYNSMRPYKYYHK